MQYNRLGTTGLIVSELCLGAMTFGTRATASLVGGLDQAQSTALVAQAFAAGVNFIDTANNYMAGQSEEFVGAALKDLGIARSDVVLATKGRSRVADGPNAAGAHRYHLLDQIDASLRRLQVDHVDLYQVHGWDAETPMEETLRALEDIVRAGKARYVGVSNWAAWQVARALGIAERRGFDSLASLQAYYSVAGRDLEREIVPLLAAEGMGLLVWSPLAGGLLSGKYRRDTDNPKREGRRSRLDFPPVDADRAHRLIDAMTSMAESREVAIAAIALAWLLHQPAISSVIVGAKSGEQLAQNLASSNVALTAKEIGELDRLSALPPEYPGWILDRKDLQPRASPRRTIR